MEGLGTQPPPLEKWHLKTWRGTQLVQLVQLISLNGYGGDKVHARVDKQRLQLTSHSSYASTALEVGTVMS